MLIDIKNELPREDLLADRIGNPGKPDPGNRGSVLTLGRNARLGIKT